MLAQPMTDATAAALPRIVWSVAALTRAIADTLATRFAAIVVRGEISGFSRAASGHCYFSLKDSDGNDALLRCAMFRRAAALLEFMPADGMVVELRARPALYEPRGDLQLVVESMSRAGAGALMEQFLRLKAKLEAEGLFDATRKRALPPFPRRIGIVTSLGAAALRDVCAALARRAPHVEAIVYPAAVQGVEAPGALERAIVLAGTRAEVETLIVCRGGGSLEDLWAFNDERVVRAIVASPIPVVVGVGHETDISLADFAADLRAPTPTAAAELCAPARSDLLGTLATLAKRQQRAMAQRLDAHAQRVDRTALRLARPAEVLQRHATRLDLIEQRRRASMTQSLALRQQWLRPLSERLRRGLVGDAAARRARLDALGARLALLDPQQVLQRGYAIVETADGILVVDPHQIHANAELRLSLARGRADVHVQSIRALE
jgi:exodeoxyribonuclease VII large subunit